MIHKHIYVNAFLLSLLTLSLFSCYVSEVRADDWLSGWSYRKSHTIQAAAGSGSDYTIMITAHYGSGSDSSSDVYLASLCRTDFGDVRWADNDGISLLDYYIASKVDGDNAVFWIEIADDLSSASVIIYIYFGNTVTTTSSPEDTFVQYDDFSGSLDAWTVDVNLINENQTASIEDDQLRFTHNLATYSHVQRSLTTENILMQAKLKRTTEYSEQTFSLGLAIYFNLYDFARESLVFNTNEPTSRYFRCAVDIDATAASYDTAALLWTSGSYAWVRITLNATHLRTFISLNGLSWTVHQTVARPVSWNSPTLAILGHGWEWRPANYPNPDFDNTGTLGNYSVTTWADDYFVRKYILPEPVQTLWGSLETEPISNSQRWIGIALPHVYAAITLWSIAMIVGIGVVLMKSGDLSVLPYLILIGLGILICLFVSLAVLSGFLQL